VPALFAAKPTSHPLPALQIQTIAKNYYGSTVKKAKTQAQQNFKKAR